MADPLKPYVVRQGDHLAKLAFVRGFDADEVWNHPKNEDLRKLRPDPSVLAPGDILNIPDKKADPLAIQSGSENAYSAKVPRVALSVIFLDAEKAPLANEPYELRGLPADDAAPSPTTDAQGKADFTVPLDARTADVFFPKKHILFKLGVGDLDPHTEASGAPQRLKNLGLLEDSVADALATGDADEEEALYLRDALVAFQAANGLPATGVLDEATSGLLADKHGR